ncbi:MAG: TAXI family TRAP transporter solute-binding subunit [Dehalococcoidales bacterium]|nr:TAXI family TRAP transporter solute-binding subunit [Dehalococcoidales bacterium]
MKKLISIVMAVGLVLAVVITACSKPAPAPTTPSPKPSASPSATPTPAPATAPTPTSTPKPTVKEWISQSSGESTYGYTVGAALARVANQSLEKAGVPLRMKNVAGPGTTTNFRAYDKGETDMFSNGTFANLQAWTNAGVFEKEPLKHKSYQGVYFYSADMFPMIRPDAKNTIKSYADFAGKKVWPYSLGSNGYESSRVALEALGIWDKIQIKQVGYDQVGNSLKTGVFDVALVSAIGGGRSAPPWTQELILTQDVSVVNPTDPEKKTIASAQGLTPTIYPASRLFGTKNPGVTEIWNFSMYQGLNFPAYGTVDEVYAMTKAWFDHTDDLIAIDQGFKQFAEDGLKFNAQVLDSLPGVPIHPGVAKYYKERGLWHDSWKIGEVQPKNW